RPHEWPRQLRRRPVPVRRRPRRRRQRRGRFQPGVQPAVRVHVVRHLPAAAAGEPPRPGDHRRREEVRGTCALIVLLTNRKERRMQSPPRLSRSRWLVVLLVAVWSVASVGQPPVDAPAPAPEVVFVPPKDPPLPLLWQVSDADNTVYLLGSFHLLKADDYPLSSDVNEAFADAEAVVFEMPPEEMSSPQLPVQMMQAAVRTDGTTLDDELPADTAARLHEWEAANSAILQASGMTPERMQMFEPWFVALMISMT